MTTAPAARQPLTVRQNEIYREICAFWRAQGRPPTIRDLCTVLAIKSSNGVSAHLSALAAKGWIERAEATTARAIWPAGLKAKIAAIIEESTDSPAGEG